MNKLTKSHMLFIIFFLLVVANSRFLIDIGISSYLEYIVCGFLTALSIYTFIKNMREDKNKIIIFFFIIVFLFSIGIILQGLPLKTELRLVLTMIALASYMMLSGNILNEYKHIRAASYGVFIGTIFTTLLGLINDINMNEKIYDKKYRLIFDMGFTGGLQYKNYYACAILAAFMGIYLCYTHEKKKKSDFIILIILTVLELFSGSKGGYLLFAIFVILQQFEKIKITNGIKFSKGIKIVISSILIVLSIFSIKWSFENVLSQSSTYGYRIRGVENYISYVKNDYFHLLFGNAEMAYMGSSTYVQNIRSFLNKNNYKAYDGSYEMGFINALIKNGIIGLIGFFLIYIFIIKKAISFSIRQYKIETLSLLFVLLISSFVESYVCNIHAIFGVYCYILISGIINMGENKENSNKEEVSVKYENSINR